MMEHDGVAISSYPRVRALYNYSARSEKELNFQANDVLTVLDIVSEVWWEGAFNGAKGYIPASYVEHSPLEGGDVGAAENTPTAVPAAHDDQSVAGGAGAQPPPPPLAPPAEKQTGSRQSLAADVAELSLEGQQQQQQHEEGSESDFTDGAQLPPPPPDLISELHGELGARAPAVEVVAEGQGRGSDEAVASPAGARRPRAGEDRPDIATALKIHQIKNKHKDLAPKKSGPNEIQQQLHRMQSRRGDKEAAAQETEFSKALKSQRTRMESVQREQDKQANMSELEKKFLRRNTERRD